MKTVYRKEYNFTYSRFDETDICKYYRYFAITADPSYPKFRIKERFRYDGLLRYNIIIFGYKIHWGEDYEWIDNEHPEWNKVSILV